MGLMHIMVKIIQKAATNLTASVSFERVIISLYEGNCFPDYNDA